MSEAELREKITALGNLDDETRTAVVCALIGHSRIQTGSWGYFYCARCGALLGDSLGGFYAEACEVVLVGRDNERCRENYKKCTWKDKIFCPDPFEKENDDDTHKK